MKKEYKQRGGVLIGLLNFTWPFASIVVSQDNITIRVLFKKYTFTKSNIKALKKHNGIFSVGLKIEHTNSEVIGKLIFWTFNYKKLKSALEHQQYVVE